MGREGASVSPEIVAELQAMARQLGLPRRRLALAIKRLVDVVCAGLGLLFTGPLILLLAWLVRRDSPGPAFFVQERLGQQGRPFRLYKLRTMTVGAEQMGAGLAISPDDPRITRFGKWLRATSLDELPQLWNILRGDMSFVGPRALPVQYFPRFSPRQRLRLLMPQGITGWAQIAGRNEVSWPRRLELDVWYVHNWSLWLDLKIALITIWMLLTRRGLTAPDGTVPEFTGEQDGQEQGGP
jgi:lipopolysaccharide/colanic/teichoic acid biosynthesis glycosyltransferase